VATSGRNAPMRRRIGAVGAGRPTKPAVASAASAKAPSTPTKKRSSASSVGRIAHLDRHRLVGNGVEHALLLAGVDEAEGEQAVAGRRDRGERGDRRQAHGAVGVGLGAGAVPQRPFVRRVEPLVGARARVGFAVGDPCHRDAGDGLFAAVIVAAQHAHQRLFDEVVVGDAGLLRAFGRRDAGRRGGGRRRAWRSALGGIRDGASNGFVRRFVDRRERRRRRRGRQPRDRASEQYGEREQDGWAGAHGGAGA